MRSPSYAHPASPLLLAPPARSDGRETARRSGQRRETRSRHRWLRTWTPAAAAAPRPRALWLRACWARYWCARGRRQSAGHPPSIPWRHEAPLWGVLRAVGWACLPDAGPHAWPGSATALHRVCRPLRHAGRMHRRPQPSARAPCCTAGCSLSARAQARFGGLLWRPGLLRALLDAVQAAEAGGPGAAAPGGRGSPSSLAWLLQARGRACPPRRASAGPAAPRRGRCEQDPAGVSCCWPLSRTLP